MSTYRAGDWVKVTFDRAMVQADDADGYLTIAVGCDDVRFCLHEDGVTVEHVAPAEWPPKPGDRWRDREQDAWIAFADEADKRTRFMIPRYGATYEVDDILARFGPLRLEHREEPTW